VPCVEGKRRVRGKQRTLIRVPEADLVALYRAG